MAQKQYGIGNDGLVANFSQNVWYRGTGAPSDATINWFKSGIGLSTFDNVLLWRTWIADRGLQRELDSLSDAINQEINAGFFRISPDTQSEYVNQSTEYKALHDEFILFQEIL